MLIYSKKLAVCPITTHLPLKLVTKKINKKIISNKISLINDFYEKNFKLRPQIAILGLNTASIVETADSGFIACGYSNSQNLNYDVFIVKMDKNGALEWSKR